MLYMVGLVASLFFAVRWYVKTDAGKYKLLALCMKIPGIKTVFKYRFLAAFLHGLAMLLKGGMRLVPALHVVQGSTEGQLFANQIQFVEQAVESGSSLSNALAQTPGRLFSQDIIAMVMVGEESAQLPNMLDRIAQVYHEKVKRQLTATTVLVQPLFMLLLGLLVVALIFAVYGPIFNLANAVGV
jgi:type IV pilus assembly protein PilC